MELGEGDTRQNHAGFSVPFDMLHRSLVTWLVFKV